MVLARCFSLTLRRLAGATLWVALLSAAPLLAGTVGAPAGDRPVVRVATVDELLLALETAQPHSTILIADGHYFLPRYVEIAADEVTVRGSSGVREAVILDGARSRHRELIGIRNASGVTIADITVQNVQANGIKIHNDTPVHDVVIRNCVLRNIWQRGIKSVRSPVLKTRNGIIEGCLFVNDRPKRFEDDPYDNPSNFNGNYIAGIDLMDAVGWHIRDNVFRNIQGRTRVGRGAIFIWFESRDCVIERNVIVDCDQGIALGNAHKPADTPLHASGFLVRNNFIARAPMNPLFLAHTSDVRLVHNTVFDPDNPRHRSVRIFADNDGLRMVGNLIQGHAIRLESVVGGITIEPNHIDRLLGPVFTDSGSGNLRLLSGTIAGLPRYGRLPEVPEDIDGRERPAATLPGAHDPTGAPLGAIFKLQ